MEIDTQALRVVVWRGVMWCRLRPCAVLSPPACLAPLPTPTPPTPHTHPLFFPSHPRNSTTNQLTPPQPHQAKICEQLDSALLTDDEMALYTTKWASLPDPEHAGAPAAAGGGGSGTQQQQQQPEQTEAAAVAQK